MDNQKTRYVHSDYDVVHRIECTTVNAFLTELSPRGPTFGYSTPGLWLFRGHSSHEAYELIPSALRKSWPGFDISIYGNRTTNRDQVRAELKLLSEFFEMADTTGLSIPEDSFHLRSLLEDCKRKIPELWPPFELLSLMALAQHHGLPTRLLDWSRSHLKAAHFAAYGAMKNWKFEGHLSVWALFCPAVEHLESPFRIVTAPAASNPNLRAQEGAFTLAGQVPSNLDAKDTRTLEDIIFDRCLKHLVKLTPAPLRCFTLPQECAIELSRALALEGVTRASLFPDFYGVVDAVKHARFFLPQFPTTPA